MTDALRAVLTTVLVCLGLSCAISPAVMADESPQAADDFFENRIRPVLVKRCFKCHSGNKREGGLRLDQRVLLLKGGQSGRVVVAGDPDASVLIRAIRRVDDDLKMPPDDSAKLTADEVRDFVTWVKTGVPFPDSAGTPAVSPASDLTEARRFWSLQPVANPEPPDAGTSRWPHNEIDQFVLARLNAERMQPAVLAERRALLRRVTYDLTGLPPTQTEVDAFLADSSPDAFATVVDRLLESDQHGVHWSRHWFDVARYGDTRWVGAGEDRRWPFAYTYRDWVIRALNEDMPYDRFVTLQLAADQVPDARPADQAALGFLTVGRWFTGQLPDVIDDQIDVVTRGLLGLSAQCARCHDHKFDPVSTQDYYSLYGLFAASRMPVDGNGVLAELPEVAVRPVDATTEQEIAGLHRQVDEFLNTRLESLRQDFRAHEKVRKYFPIAGSLCEQDDNAVREFAKANELDDQLLLRWVRYFKRSVPHENRQPDAIFSPWHALVAVPEADFATAAPDIVEKQLALKLNPHVAAMLTPAPKSLAELATRYLDLFFKHEAEEEASDFYEESIRRVLGGNDTPAHVRLNELSQFLSAEEMQQLVEMRRKRLAKLSALPERADHFLTYQHEAAPLLKEVSEFLTERRKTAAADVRSADKIATYLLSAHEAREFGPRPFRLLARKRQLSQVILRRWVDFLEQHARQNDAIFAAWRLFTDVEEENFADRSAAITEQARTASGNRAVAEMLATPPTSLSDVAQRFAELLVRCQQSEPFADADQEAVRQLVVGPQSPMRYTPEDVVDHFTRKDFDQLRNKERNLVRLYLESPGTPPLAMTMRESSRGYEQRVFVRGNEFDLGEPSHGGFMTVLSKQPRPFTQGRGRAELAQAIVDPLNPLTARVIVNRVWQWHFGAGLVSTPSDFGTRGTAPSHPELLDWLASRFVADGWSLKKLHRQILLSATWQQSSQDNPAYRAVDPENRLLWRMSRRRLSFEEIRDSLLAASGRLDHSIGGPPTDLVRNIVRRRTVFGKVDRMALPGFYRYFDFPGADTHVPARHETIVAQQALYLMNNGFVMQQASHASLRTAATDNPTARIDALYRLILGRDPSGEERSLSLEFINSQQEEIPVSEPPVADDSKETVESPADAWRYGWGSYDAAKRRVTDFHPFPFSDGGRYRGGADENDPELGRMNLHGRGGYAGPNNDLAVIRRWIAPRGGRLSITGMVTAQMNTTEPMGDGVRARIVSSRNGQLGVWLTCGTEEPTDLKGVSVEPGDTIDFVVDARGRETHGNYNWAPNLTMESETDTDTSDDMKLVWDSGKDFKAVMPVPAPFDAWQRFAQVLLESNEFMFLD